jgi:hypothetical protein
MPVQHTANGGSFGEEMTGLPAPGVHRIKPQKQILQLKELDRKRKPQNDMDCCVEVTARAADIVISLQAVVVWSGARYYAVSTRVMWKRLGRM